MNSPLRVAIIGGGASGLLCALYSKNGNTAVTVYEKNLKVGKKLLATGNGRCNFSNTNMSGDGLYNNGAFAGKYLIDLQREFNSLGLCSYADNEGRVYPITESAKTLLDCITRGLNGVEIRYNCEITSVKKEEDVFALTAGGKTFFADTVVLATGSCARAEVSGKKLLPEDYFTPLYPSLTPLTTKNNLKHLDGLRHKCSVHLLRNGERLYSEGGEVQFRSFGLSGIVCFNMSAAIARRMRKGEEGFSISLDLFPSICLENLRKLLHERYNIHDTALFLGLLDARLVAETEKRIGVISKKNIDLYAALLKNLDFDISSLGDFTMAQVASGGVKTEFLSDTLELKTLNGFYVCGEAVDIDGICGGYNLAWAFSSGITVGSAISKRANQITQTIITTMFTNII